jgi:hypothetical protein
MIKRTKKVFALFIMFLMVFPYLSMALTNGDFESGVTGWSSWNATSVATTGARTGGSGTQYVKTTVTTAGGSIYQTETGIAADGSTWRLVGWVRVANGVSANFGFFGTSSPYSSSNTNAIITGTGTWTAYTIQHSWSSINFSDGYRDVQLSMPTVGNTADLDDITTQNLGAVQDWCFY